MFIRNGIGNTGGLLGGLPRVARAMVMGLGSTTVRTVTLTVTRENLGVLAGLLESGAVRVVIDKAYSLDRAAAAVAHMLGHHARGQVAITVP